MINAIIEELVENQKTFFNSDITKNIDFRIDVLKKLYQEIKLNEEKIEEALYKDLNKSAFESYETEIGIVLQEIKFVIKNLRKWAGVKKVKTPLMHFPSKSFIYKEPYGVVLIMSPWNYPFNLTMIPLIGAVAAGNCCVVKPSQYSLSTAKLVADIIQKVFNESHVAVIQGGRESNTILLEQKFDYIFFTGSPKIGHVVLEAAAKNLTPVTLELGGKSPCIVDNSAKIKLAAKRIVWGKFLNCGQTCIAPDYILVQENVKEELISEIKFYIKEFYGENPTSSEIYPKIINEKHFARLRNLIEEESNLSEVEIEKIFTEGNISSCKIPPVIIDNANWDSPLMEDEIFGPVLPVISFKSYDEIIPVLKTKPKSLALYLFTTKKENEKLIMNNLSFGCGCINDTIIQISNSYLSFGGVGNSGMGKYHGKESFETFSHTKTIMKKSNLIDIKLRYPPFNDNINLLRKIIK